MSIITGKVLVEEEDLLEDSHRYMNNAYDKGENDTSGFDLLK